MSKLLHSNIPIAQDSIEQPTSGLNSIYYTYTGDLDTLNHGLCMCYNCKNRPDSGDWGMAICVKGSSNSATIQLYICLRSATIYRRWASGGAWNSWEQL